jgi:hypothetical protein
MEAPMVEGAACVEDTRRRSLRRERRIIVWKWMVVLLIDWNNLE